MPNQPMAEVFGYKIDDFSAEAQRHRRHRLCPFNNRVPSCTKDKANDPFGVCSIYHGEDITVTCPIRFRQDWLIATDAAEFFFPEGTTWTSFAGDFLMTYDNADELHTLAARHGFDTVLVAMKNTHHAEMTELLIGRSLDWVRQP